MRMRLALMGLATSIALGASFGCGGSGANSGGTTPSNQPLPRIAPGSLVVALGLDGQDADLGKTERCQAVLERNGVMVRPESGIMVQLTLNEGRHMVRIFRRLSVSNFQLLRQAPKPDWSMAELCTDLVREIVAALGAPATAPVTSVGAPPPATTGAPPELPPPGYGGPPPQPYAPPPQAHPVAPVELPLLPTPASLPPAAAQHAAAGEQAFRAGDFTRAHGAYAEAHRQSGDAALLYNLGLCYVRLGRSADGLKYLQLYLDRAPNAPNRAAVERKLAELRRALGDDD